MTERKALRAAVVVVSTILASCGLVGGPPGTAGANPLQASVWDVAAGERITPEALAERLGQAEFVVLGEVHDNAVHHERQAWLIEALAPPAVAFEMVPEASERGIEVFRAEGGAAEEIGPAIGWERLGWPAWEIYRPVFEAAGAAYIAGGGVARADVGRAMREGARAVYGPGAELAGLGVPLSPVLQAAAEREMIDAHCGVLPVEAATGMVEAQRLRDARFAAATVRAADRAAEPGGAQVRAVLVTGNGHARTDVGSPVYLARLKPGARVLSLGQIEVAEGAERLADYAEGGAIPFDFVWFSERAERPDPCEAFLKGRQ